MGARVKGFNLLGRNNKVCTDGIPLNGRVKEEMKSLCTPFCN